MSDTAAILDDLERERGILKQEIPLILGIIDKLSRLFPEDVGIVQTSSDRDDDNEFTFKELIVAVRNIRHILEYIYKQLSIVDKHYTQEDADCFLERLIRFKGSDYLKEYSNSAFDIHDRSKESEPVPEELKKLWKIDFLPVQMDHILFKVIKHNYYSLKSLLEYPLFKRSTPYNLKTTYDKSIEIADNIEDVDGSFLWFTNMKIPITYAKTSSVSRHYKGIHSIIISKKNIDVRRIHLFYDSFNNISNRGSKENSRALFTNLLLEYLHGINSRVLIVRDYKKLQAIAPWIDIAGRKIGDLFLLDYALNYSNTGQTESSKYLKGDRFTLCADFSADLPEAEMSTEEHEKDKVYVLEEPLIFSLFQQHFFSLWNKDNYVEYIKTNFISERDQKIADVLRENLTLLDFFQFWEYSVYDHWENLLDMNVFNNRYVFEAAKVSEKEVLEIVKNATQVHMKRENFKREVNEIRLREIHSSNNIV